jgi:hypothetical protein
MNGGGIMAQRMVFKNKALAICTENGGSIQRGTCFLFDKPNATGTVEKWRKCTMEA